MYQFCLTALLRLRSKREHAGLRSRIARACWTMLDAVALLFPDNLPVHQRL